MKLKCFFFRWWPFIIGFFLIVFFAALLDAQDKPSCQVLVHEEAFRYSDGKLAQQNIIIVAKTDTQELSHYESIKGPRGEVKWKEMWKLRRKAESDCEEYLEFREKQLAKKGGDLPSRAANTPAP